MAYMDFSYRGTAELALMPSASVPAPPHAVATDLTESEWSVVGLARQDGMSSLFPTSRLSRFVRLIFGIARKNPLSDPRLEALRRMAVMSWHHGYNVASSEISEFLTAGYSEAQYETLLERIVAMRARRGRI